jgi:hypothetical protein
MPSKVNRGLSHQLFNWFQKITLKTSNLSYQGNITSQLSQLSQQTQTLITLLAATTFKDFYKTSVKLDKALWTVLRAMQAQNWCKNKSRKNLTS